ncbi:hypothetical protein D9M71_796230 [compost metagenome]
MRLPREHLVGKCGQPQRPLRPRLARAFQQQRVRCMDQGLQQNMEHHVAQVRQRFILHHQLGKHTSGRQFAA